MAFWRGACVGPNRTRREGAREHGVTRTRSPLGAKWDLAHRPKVVTVAARLAIYDQWSAALWCEKWPVPTRSPSPVAESATL